MEHLYVYLFGCPIKKGLKLPLKVLSDTNNWNKKCKSDDAPHELAPIMFTESKEHFPPVPSFTGELPSGATLLFPNGLKVHFGIGTEAMLMDVLKQSLAGHVLP